MRTSLLAVLLISGSAACSQEVTTGRTAPSAVGGPRELTPIPAVAVPQASRATARATMRASAFPTIDVPGHTKGAILASAAHGSSSDDTANAIAADGPADVVVAGSFGGSADIGCGVHDTTATAAYVAKMTAGGACAWAVYFDGDWVSPSAVAVAGDGSIYVAGGVYGTATFDVPRTTAGGQDGFVVKLSSTGSIVWARTFGGADEDYAYALAASSTGVSVGGAFYGTTSFGDDGAATPTSNGDADAFLVTYGAAAGELVASRTFGGPGWDAINAMAFDATAGLIASGTHAGGFVLGSQEVASAGGQDGFVATYDSALATRAARSFGGPGDDAAHGVTVDAGGRIVASGYFTHAAAIGGPVDLVGSGAHTAFWAAYDADLAFAASGTLDSDGETVAEALTARPGGGVVIGGHFTGTLMSGMTPSSAGASRAGFAASFDADGTLVWATPICASADTMILGLASSGSGVVAVGSSDGTLAAGSSTPNAGGSDMVMITLGD
ncbi:MAG: hypothetical protein JWP87_3353 [Labilithrix sp.]|nr:hypothetical protein [Labilithrix sp.]